MPPFTDGDTTMATQRAKEFIEKVNSDPSLKQRIVNAHTREERHQIIDELGYNDLTRDDILEAVRETNAAGSATGKEVDAASELSDAELEAVAGGDTTLWLSAVTVLAATLI